MKTPILETKSLILRPLTKADAKEAFERWTSDPDVARYMIYNTHQSIDDKNMWLSTINSDSDTAYDFAVCVKAEDNYLCGSCGVYLSKIDDVFDVGYNIAKDHWRRGYGTEIIEALRDFVINGLHETQLGGRYHKENVVSGHVLQKYGLMPIGEAKGFKLDGVTPFETYVLRYQVKGNKTPFVLANGVSVDPVGFGTYKSEQGAVTNALKTGYRYFDTASFYKNEEMVGKEISDYGISREEVFIASKIWPTEFGYEETYKAFQRSIDKLKTSYLDLYLIHWPKITASDKQWKNNLCKTWKAMEELYKEGKIRAIGVSNFLPHHLRVITENFKIKPMVNQLELHPGYMQHYTVDYCRKNNIHVQAWSPLGRGRLSDNELIRKIADKYLVSPQKLMLRFLNQEGISVIPKTNDPEKMSKNLEIFDFTISEDDMSFLNTLPPCGFSGEFADTVEFEGRM